MLDVNVIEFFFEPHPWWVWAIIVFLVTTALVWWIKKPWYDVDWWR